MKKLWAWSAVIFGSLFVLIGCSVYGGVSPENVSGFLSEALSHQVTQFSLAFTIAAWLHSREVKKEIKAQFINVVTSIDGVANALRQDLAAQTVRIEKIEDGMAKMSNRVENLEKQTNKGEKI